MTKLRHYVLATPQKRYAPPPKKYLICYLKFSTTTIGTAMST